MQILGLYLVGHDPSIALIKNGQIERIIEGERITGMRYGLGMPFVHTEPTLDTSFSEGVGYWGKILYDYLQDYKEIQIERVVWAAPQREKRSKWQHTVVKAVINWVDQNYPDLFVPNLEIQGYDHHLCHAALAYYTSPFDHALILSYDGRGNDGHTVWFLGKGSRLIKIKTVNLRFGSMYSFCAQIVNDEFGFSEAKSGKLMGLSAYGKVIPSFYSQSRKWLSRSHKGKPYLRSRMTTSWPGWLRRYGSSLLDRIEVFNGVGDKRAWDWMASFQKAWTDMVIEMTQEIRQEFRVHNLCFSGGCALNGITNTHVHNLITSNFYVPPNPNDCGLAAGAALYDYYHILEHPWRPLENAMSPYKGTPLLDSDQLALYQKHKSYRGSISLDTLVEFLSQGYIIGVVQGNSEIGPRALGNRSILCDPTSPDIRGRLNKMVKFREWYRPFAPIVRFEDMSIYFEADWPVPYMSMIVNVQPQYRSLLPGITHVDGTARVQTVTSQQNLFLWNLLACYKAYTGIGVLLNTSFNTKGKAILTTLEESIRILETTGLDGVYSHGHLWLNRQNNQPPA